MTIPEPQNNRYAATIGFFDGVHLGHVHLLEQLKAAATGRGLKSMAITFPEHPRQILQSDYRPRLLSTPDDKMRMLEQTGIDYCFPLHFTSALAAMDARSFMTDFLQKRLGVSMLLVGHDHHFGHDTNLNVNDYKKIGNEIGMEVIPADAYLYQGIPVSSSRIRRELVAGNVKQAAAMLGYDYSLVGVVVAGNHLGRTIGFPTANIRLYEPLKLLPGNGVYSVEVESLGRKFRGMCNIGTRPTVNSGTDTTVETNIFDFDEDIYGLDLKVTFLTKIREERRFESLDALKAQLEQDRKSCIVG